MDRRTVAVIDMDEVSFESVREFVIVDEERGEDGSWLSSMDKVESLSTLLLLSTLELRHSKLDPGSARTRTR